MEDPVREALESIASAAGLALEVLQKHRQFTGEAPAGLLGIKALEGLQNAFRDYYEALAQPAELVAPNQMFGIIDPDYARVYTQARIIAWQYGFACLAHGSFTRDLDLLLVPWADTAQADDVAYFAPRIAEAAGLKESGHQPSVRPHGRKTWTLLFPGFADSRWVDLSVMTPAAPPAPQPAAPSPWRDHLAAIDSKALATAQEIALMWGQDRSQFVSRIQVAVTDAMLWMKSSVAAPQPAGRALTADDLWNNHEIMSINGAEAGLSMDTLLKLARAIERAHGIKGE